MLRGRDKWKQRREGKGCPQKRQDTERGRGKNKEFRGNRNRNMGRRGEGLSTRDAGKTRGTGEEDIVEEGAERESRSTSDAIPPTLEQALR